MWFFKSTSLVSSTSHTSHLNMLGFTSSWCPSSLEILRLWWLLPIKCSCRVASLVTLTSHSVHLNSLEGKTDSADPLMESCRRLAVASWTGVVLQMTSILIAWQPFNTHSCGKMADIELVEWYFFTSPSSHLQICCCCSVLIRSNMLNWEAPWQIRINCFEFVPLERRHLIWALFATQSRG